MKIVFFGTPSFAAEILGYLLDHSVSVAAVVTQPDRPKGRALQLTPSPVKSVVQERASHIPLFQPEKASNPEFLSELAALKADLFVVVAYGQILPQKLLDIPPLGSINVHTSLLPKYRGAAPIHRALMNGETETGVAIQRIVLKLDAGDIIALEKTEIPLDMTFAELEKRLCDLAKPLLLSVIEKFSTQGMLPGAPQNHDLATYAAKVELEEGEIDWAQNSKKIHDLIRAFSPRPGAWCRLGDKRLKILKSRWLADSNGKAGELLAPNGTIACGNGAIQLIEVQPEGKKSMQAADWLRGQKKFTRFE